MQVSTLRSALETVTWEVGLGNYTMGQEFTNSHIVRLVSETDTQREWSGD